MDFFCLAKNKGNYIEICQQFRYLDMFMIASVAGIARNRPLTGNEIVP